MSTLQKVIKYLALAFALVLIVNIVSGILLGLYGLTEILGLKKEDTKHSGNLEEIIANIENDEIETLKIDLEYSNLKILKGESFKVESNSSDISYTQNKNKLVIEEKKHNWIANKDISELVVYIPENMTFDKVKLETGAGEMYIENLEAKELSFEIGAGKAEIEELNISEKAKIEGGAGKVEILAGTINDLDLDMGVGEFTLNAKLTGKNDIDSGVGKLNIDLTDDLENYRIKVSKGIGSITIDRKECEDGKEYGSGENYLSVDGGVGAIEIK